MAWYARKNGTSAEKIVELKIKNVKNIYHEVAMALLPYRGKETCSVEFIVEGTKDKPIVGIRYPGRKVVKRKMKSKRVNVAKWGNLFDFAVVPYIDGKEVTEQEFTFEKILEDFEKNKKDNEEFWKLIEDIYYKNELLKEPPKLLGIDPKLFLLVLKWIWIEEDFNYKLGWKDVGSPIRYVLLSRRGKPTGKGAGRAKFFAALILLKHHFTLKEVKKIIPLYA
jgi:hypothetical protein